MDTGNKLFGLLILIFLLGCSFGGSGVWNDLSEEIKIAKQRENSKIIFSTKKKFSQEIVNKDELKLNEPSLNKNWTEQNFSANNFVPHLKYSNKINLISKTKKLGKNNFNISNVDFEPIIENDIIFFYDPRGNIYSYSLKNNKLVWKYNFYKKCIKIIRKK